METVHRVQACRGDWILHGQSGLHSEELISEGCGVVFERGETCQEPEAEQWCLRWVAHAALIEGLRDAHAPRRSCRCRLVPTDGRRTAKEAQRAKIEAEEKEREFRKAAEAEARAVAAEAKAAAESLAALEAEARRVSGRGRHCHCHLHFHFGCHCHFSWAGWLLVKERLEETGLW